MYYNSTKYILQPVSKSVWFGNHLFLNNCCNKSFGQFYLCMIQLPYLTSGDSNINRFIDLFIKSIFSSLAHIAYHSGPPQARSKCCSQTDCLSLITCTPWICCCLVTKLCLTFYDAMACGQRRQWQPTPVLLPGKSHGWRSLVGH